MAENLREIVFDTETTGLSFTDDRIVEIGCVEMINHTPTGKTYHCYINPQRDIPEEVVRIHGLTNKFLSDKPIFSEIVDDFLNFIGDAMLVAHNGGFDMNMINAELKRLSLPELSNERLIDTFQMSRKQNPHLAKHNLDALCERYGIDNSERDLHGALLDARLLAEVYIELLGGKEVDFFKKSDVETSLSAETNNAYKKNRTFHEPRHFPATSDELTAHAKLLTTFKGKDIIWNHTQDNN